MTCKHRYEPFKFGLKYRKPNTHWWSCKRCGHTIFSELSAGSITAEMQTGATPEQRAQIVEAMQAPQGSDKK
jgi:hypothetical protein